MADRYVRKLEFNNDVYLPSCPVALEKGAVLLDTKTDAYFLQLKFAYFGTVGMASIRVCIESLDNAGQLLYPETTAMYEEHTVTYGTFGTKKLLPIPNNNASMFRVYIDKLTTVDGRSYSYLRDQNVSGCIELDISVEREKALKIVEQQSTIEALQRKFEKATLALGMVSIYVILFGSPIIFMLTSGIIWLISVTIGFTSGIAGIIVFVKAKKRSIKSKLLTTGMVLSIIGFVLSALHTIQWIS